MRNFDDILHEINEFGPYQQIRYFLICLAAMLPGIATYVHSFMAARPSYMCDQTIFEEDEGLSFTNVTYEKCHYLLDGVRSQSCNSWKFDETYYATTLTEDWSMVCDRSYLRQNVQIVYFSGYIFGALLLGYLADRFGRRPIMLSSFILIILGGIGSAFGPQESFGFTTSYVIYTVSRFLIACGTRGINVTGYILALEIVGPSHRAFAAMVFTAFFGLGQLVLVVAAYFIRDWRTLGIAMIFPYLPFIGCFFVIAESPRWLIMKNKSEMAYSILQDIAKKNKTKLSESTWKSFTSQIDDSEPEPTETYFHLLKSPKLVIITLTLFLNWIITNLVFYGIGLKSNDLGVNPYLSFAFSAIVEIIAVLITTLLISKYGRKVPYIVSLLISAVSCVSIYFTDGHVMATLILALMGKFAISSSYAIIHLYSSEIFPTTMRGITIGSCSMMARIGSILAPSIITLDDHYTGLPFLIFGCGALVAAFTALILPETLNRKLPRNLEEAENLKTMMCLKNTYHKDICEQFE